MKKKNNIYEPVSVEEAINYLQTFLESDLWSKFKDEKIKGKIWVREDKFEKEEDLWKYLEGHFNILRREIKKLRKEKNEEHVNRAERRTEEK